MCVATACRHIPTPHNSNLTTLNDDFRPQSSHTVPTVSPEVSRAHTESHDSAQRQQRPHRAHTVPRAHTEPTQCPEPTQSPHSAQSPYSPQSPQGPELTQCPPRTAPHSARSVLDPNSIPRVLSTLCASHSAQIPPVYSVPRASHRAQTPRVLSAPRVPHSAQSPVYSILRATHRAQTPSVLSAQHKVRAPSITQHLNPRVLSAMSLTQNTASQTPPCNALGHSTHNRA